MVKPGHPKKRGITTRIQEEERLLLGTEYCRKKVRNKGRKK